MQTKYLDELIKIMELSILLFNQILAMLIMVGFGFALVKSNAVKDDQDSALSKIVLYISCPCCIINSFLIEFSNARLLALIIAFILSVCIHLLFIALTKHFNLLYPMEEIERASLVYANAGNYIVPLVAATLGAEYVFYVVPYFSVQNIFLWTHGKKLISHEKNRSLKKILTTPCFIAIYIGLFLFLVPIQLPNPVASAINSASDSLGYISMLVIGMTLAQTKFKDIIGSIRVYIICLGRLIVYPLIVLGILFVINQVFGQPFLRDIFLAVFLPSAAPTAAAISQFAQIYKRTPELAGSIIIVSVILSTITLPLFMFVFQKII